MKCTEEMYEAFKAVFYDTTNGNETMRDLTMNALEAAMATAKPVAKIVSKYGDPEAFGEREIDGVVDLSKIPYNTPLYAFI